MLKSHICAEHVLSHEIQAHSAIINADEAPEQPVGRNMDAWRAYQRPQSHMHD